MERKGKGEEILRSDTFKADCILDCITGIRIVMLLHSLHLAF